ncbi:hypothetical protein [Planktomarina sp.]|nr:hypothetical protein [Planktomarina sp.]
MLMDSMISPELLNELCGGIVVVMTMTMTMASAECRKICPKSAFKGA